MSSPTQQEIDASNDALAELGPVQQAAIMQMRAGIAAVKQIHETIGSAGAYNYDGVADALGDLEPQLEALVAASQT